MLTLVVIHIKKEQDKVHKFLSVLPIKSQVIWVSMTYLGSICISPIYSVSFWKHLLISADAKISVPLKIPIKNICQDKLNLYTL